MSRSTLLTTSSINRNNPTIKRNLRDKRRSTGIRPSDVSLASTSTEGSANEDDVEEETVAELNDFTRTLTSPKPVFPVNRIQPSMENLSITRSEASTRIFLPEEFRLPCLDKQTLDNDSSTYKSRQYEERILVLESLLIEKDHIIHDLQHQLDIVKQDLNDANEQIYKLHQDKLTLIKAFASIQENDSLHSKN